MKYLLTLIGALAANFVFAQQVTYQQFMEDAKTEINLQPEYGNIQKSDAMKREDDVFISTALQSDTTVQKASDHLVRLGFTYLYRGDFETAMKRFNQAWLLDPKNENAYWGFGAIYFSFGDYKEALNQFEKGLASRCPRNPRPRRRHPSRSSAPRLRPVSPGQHRQHRLYH